jgi:predicted site-specific integrase-resolvase
MGKDIMAKKKQKQITLTQGWAIYLRTSTDDAQNPKNSQQHQKHNVMRSLVGPSSLPVINVYSEVQSGRNPDRKQYQRMLQDAKLGRFSHIGVNETSRFGRDAAEALRAVKRIVGARRNSSISKLPRLTSRGKFGTFNGQSTICDG